MTSARSRFAWLVLLIGGVMGYSQTITPPIAEFRGFKAEDSFRIDNKTAQPMLVFVEVKGFTVNDAGKVVYSPLPSTMRVEIGASSFVIPPNDSHTVYYKAVSTESPASFSIANDDACDAVQGRSHELLHTAHGLPVSEGEACEIRCDGRDQRSEARGGKRQQEARPSGIHSCGVGRSSRLPDLSGTDPRTRCRSR